MFFYPLDIFISSFTKILILNDKYIMLLKFYIYDIYLQNPSFSNNKALQKKAKGLEIV